MVAPVDLIPELRRQLETAAQPGKAPQMKVYMKDNFAYLGVVAPDRKRAAKSFVAAGRDATPHQLLHPAKPSNTSDRVTTARSVHQMAATVRPFDEQNGFASSG